MPVFINLIVLFNRQNNENYPKIPRHYEFDITKALSTNTKNKHLNPIPFSSEVLHLRATLHAQTQLSCYGSGRCITHSTCYGSHCVGYGCRHPFEVRYMPCRYQEMHIGSCLYTCMQTHVENGCIHTYRHTMNSHRGIHRHAYRE